MTAVSWSLALDPHLASKQDGRMSGSRADFAPKDSGELKARWRTYVESKRLNVTSQREAIVEFFLRTRDHISIDELLAKVRKKHPKVGYATVYRTLKLLVDGRTFIVGHE